MEISCAVCMATFAAKRSTAKYCGATCRQRAKRGAATGPSRDTGLVQAVVAELQEADALDTYSGQLALQLAKRMSAPAATGLVALSKELRTVMAQILGPAPTPPAQGGSSEDEEPDIVDEVRRKREQREASAAALG